VVSIFAVVLKVYDHITGTRIDSGPASAVYVAVCGAVPPLWRERSCFCVTFPLPGVKLEVPILSGILIETPMTEERKHEILFAGTLLCARKMVETMESDKPNFAKQYWVDKAVDEAAFILERIERRWPQELTKTSQLNCRTVIR
jgi:hypothetical protein